MEEMVFKEEIVLQDLLDLQAKMEKKDLQDLSMEWPLTLDGEAEAAPMV